MKKKEKRKKNKTVTLAELNEFNLILWIFYYIFVKSEWA